MNIKYVERFAEFFFVGLIAGIIEDIIAIKAVTDIQITWKIVGIIALVALPFAIFSELIVDAKPLFSFFRKEIVKEEEIIKKDIVAIENAAGIRRNKKKSGKEIIQQQSQP